MILDSLFDFIAPSEIIPTNFLKINEFDVELDSFQKNELLEPETDFDLLPDRNDSVLLNNSVFSDELVEHESKSGYSFLSEKRNEFDFEKYVKDIKSIEEKERHKYIIRFPSKPELLRFKTFHITFKLFNNIRTQSENVFVKLISDDFKFNKSFFHLSDKEYEVKVSKVDESRKSFILRIKIYYDNIVVEDVYYDLYAREKCEEEF